MKPYALTLLFIAQLSVIAFSQPDLRSRAELSQSLLNKLDTRINGLLHIHLVFDKQIQFAEWNRLQEAKRSNFSERARLLLQDLKSNAALTQPAWLEKLQTIDGIEAASIKQHFIANAISLSCTQSALRSIIEMPGIRWIGENVALKSESETQTAEASFSVPEGKERGLSAIGAPEMWKLGYTGYNRLAFIADTGTDPTHPAISRQYNGLFLSNSASWYSLENNPGPYDCNRHGTHVAGTVLGLDRRTNDTIGVAFNARWIAGDILCGIGTQDNIGAFEWALNPDGDENTSDDMPDVINNSWYDPSLDTLDCYSIYVPILEALEAAGVAVIFSAGNAGPEAGTITQPHNININELNAFTVGALNGNGVNFGIANFSSIGPSHCPGDGSLKIKPEVSAPGVQVRSCVPGNNYEFLSGTSMAAPHVSGAILLLKEAFPYLGGKELKHALYHSCRDLGDPGEDNKYGMGLINVYNAYLFLISKGHQPVSPKIKDDVSLIHINHAVNACDNKLKPELLIENNGTDTLTSMQIQFSADQFNTTVQWLGTVPPGHRTNIFPTVSDFPLGTTKIAVTLIQPNGNEDVKTLHNSLPMVVNITETEEKDVAFQFEELVCQGSTFALRSPGLQNGKPLTTFWYAVPFGGNKVKEGNDILISNVDAYQTLYAEPIYRDGVGQFSNAQAGAAYPDEQGEGIVFDVHAQIVLDSVTVYSNQIGVRNFYLYNSRGDSITSTKKYINKPGLNYVKLNWSIPPGERYSLVKKEGKPLLTVPANGYFPASSASDIVTLKTGSNGDYFNYFFDWKFTFSEPCGRIPVSWEVRGDSLRNATDFTLSADTLAWPGNATLQAISALPQSGTHLWEMGDGATYTTLEVLHNYAAPGVYPVTLHTTDSLNCISVKRKSVVVKLASSIEEPSDKLIANLTIYPNPGDQSLSLIMHNMPVKEASVGIFNLQGQCLLREWISTGSELAEIKTSGLPAGAYVVLVQSKAMQWEFRWMKL